MKTTAIPKLLTTNLLWILLTVCLVFFAFTLFFGWGLMVGTLYLFFWLFRFSGWETNLSDRERWFYLMTILFYPVAETGVQWLGLRHIIPHDFTLINRLEHCCWAIALSLIFLPFISSVWQHLKPLQNLIFMAGFVCLLGNLNEFLEYFSRTQYPPFDRELFTYFYIDTIYDMIMNLIGGLIGFVILNWITPPKINKSAR